VSITLELSPAQEAAFQAQAAACGLSLEEWMLDLAKQHVQAVPSGSVAHLQKTNPREWAKHFDAWLDSHRPDVPVLSDEAMSRESIYPDIE
jgi:hypothetical protein